MTDGNVAYDDGTLVLSGPMTFQTVPDIFSRTESLIERGSSRLTVDLAQVERVDTAGIALMLEWLTRARARQCEIVFANWPQQVRRFVDVSGLNKAFGLV